jgi:hypothetical protein
VFIKFFAWRGVLDTILCEKVCQRLAAGRWFSPGTLVSSTNKTDRHDVTEILLKVALNTINQTNHNPAYSVIVFIILDSYLDMFLYFRMKINIFPFQVQPDNK